MAKAKKPKAWFKPLRNSYIANNPKGALTYIPFVAYLVASLIVAFHYVSSVLFAIFLTGICWVLGGLVMTAFAKARS